MAKMRSPRETMQETNEGTVQTRSSSDLVSVVIPTYNRPKLLHRAISSALRQTHRDFEIIVVDGSPGEEAVSVIERFGDCRISHVKQDPNTGLSAARNIGVRNSSGRYIAFLDDDDERLPEKIELQLEDLRNKESRLRASYCLLERFRDESNQVIGYFRPSSDGNHIRAWLCGENVPSPSCVLLEKECLERAGGFREDLPRLEDREQWIRLSKYYDFACLNRVLVRYHIHPAARVSNNSTALLAAYPIVYRVHKDLFWKNRKSLSLFMQRFAHVVAKAGDRRSTRLLLLKSIAAYPLRIESYQLLIVQLTNGTCRSQK